jgi:hypothetical protein
MHRRSSVRTSLVQRTTTWRLVPQSQAGAVLSVVLVDRFSELMLQISFVMILIAPSKIGRNAVQRRVTAPVSHALPVTSQSGT